jgi:hypothetical protein
VKSPEQAIQDAFVARANQELQDRKAATGWSGKRTTWPVWGPEVAVAALKELGWKPPSCACSEPGRELEEAVCGVAPPLTEKERAALDAFERAFRSHDAGETESPA